MTFWKMKTRKYHWANNDFKYFLPDKCNWFILSLLHVWNNISCSTLNATRVEKAFQKFIVYYKGNGGRGLHRGVASQAFNLKKRGFILKIGAGKKQLFSGYLWTISWYKGLYNVLQGHCPSLWSFPIFPSEI